MPAWYVESGDLRAKVEAETYEEAFMVALCMHKPRQLGRLTMFSEHGFRITDKTLITETEHLVKKAVEIGLLGWSDEVVDSP